MNKVTAPKAPKIAPEHRAAYEQGRAAYLAGIDREDAPHGEGDDLDAWRKGWDFAEDVDNAGLLPPETAPAKD